ncbi:radical SAM family heme chaperone HemW [Calditerricola satsumensis]|uniref:Coproporphyrinogen-III oxidase n=2 Tax=Calditerricola satsumensis TaxID=373054 RepID=A0A8J3B852_9BACI|nr:radical SAM family heme chaperone HemW [Calditerricola satsumensis]GGJ95092.1 oxygen-independent coproporphyrinogen-III oxidase-like protein YqeR [Calditerricola satsumensis]
MAKADDRPGETWEAVPSMGQEEPTALYIHIPFCRRKCHYCDFAVFVAQGEDLVERYLDALERELALTLGQRRPRLATVYVGGGTPTLLSARQLERLLTILHRHADLSGCLEFTMEANPETVDNAKLRVLAAGGVTRLSFGVQAFQDHLLAAIGRTHTAADAVRAVRLARQAGFHNLSIDLMLGLPGQTLADVRASLEAAFALDLPHLSAYSLKVEEQTVFYRQWVRGELHLPPEEEEAAMYLTVLEETAKRGLQQYEVSNFARPGYASLHNQVYWRNEPYYGVGVGAHGYVGGVRYANVGTLHRYLKAVAERGLPRAETHVVTPREAMEETMFLGLRLTEGVSHARFRRRHGVAMEAVFGPVIAELVGKGLLERDARGVRLTRDGLLLGNEVFARFLLDGGNGGNAND